MSQDEENTNKPKKLTLSLNRQNQSKLIESDNLKKTFVSNRTNTVTVEVKKSNLTTRSSLLSRNLTGTRSKESEENNIESETRSRLNLLKRAAEDAKQREIEIERRNNSIKERDLLEEENKASKALLAQDANNKSKITQKAPKFTPKPSDEEEDPVKKETEKLVQKIRKEEPRKLRKNDIFGMLESDEEGTERVRTRSLASIRRAKEKEKRKLDAVKQEKIYREVILPEFITVSDLANRMSERVADVIKELMKLGLIATASQTLEADTAELIVTTMGHSVKRIMDKDVESAIINEPDSPEDLTPRAPVVTVMGHVDHGKTSLLDALKQTDVAAGEAGGITQHIGAYRVNLPSKKSITFIDTPGHEAFSEMRSRGAKVTDIVVLVVAADDGIMTQTIEAINHAKAAKVPIIVAINKIDKPDANIERVKQELLTHELVPEDLGGDIIVVPVSALKKTNLDKLEESILLVAEMQDLKANAKTTASGTVIESKIDKGKGVVATLLVQRGVLRNSDLIIAGTSYGRVKRMIDDKGRDISECTPSMPAEIWGLDQAPAAGEAFAVLQSEKQARDIAEYRERIFIEQKNNKTQKTSLAEMFLKASGESPIKELPIIIKADVQGSVEAITNSIKKIVTDEVRIRVLHSGVGAISESDISLATATNGLVVGFNVRAPGEVARLADTNKVDIRYYSIIYNIIDDIKSIVSGMLSPIKREVYLGSVDIRQIFNITKVGKIAGSYVTKGIIKRGAGVRLLRDNVVIHEGKLKTLKRFKDEVKEVRENYECGIAFENYDDIKVGDTVEVFETVEEKRQVV
ncbi:MAG: translation initiation factor IF-2 [Rickettsiaceae bacterium]|nr:translation initiation factor IF-2 [Rickettsiaceae bacterium]